MAEQLSSTIQDEQISSDTLSHEDENSQGLDESKDVVLDKARGIIEHVPNQIGKRHSEPTECVRDESIPKRSRKSAGDARLNQSQVDFKSLEGGDDPISSGNSSDGEIDDQESEVYYPSAERKKKKTYGKSDYGKSAIRYNNAFGRPSIRSLKSSGDSFLQDFSCGKINFLKISKCRECRVNSVGTIKLPNTCRFYGFRKLRYTKTGGLAVVGFSDPELDPKNEHLQLWLPSKKIQPKQLDEELAKFLIDQLGDQFCELIQQEHEAIRISVSEDPDQVAWKRVVVGVREMCDICQTSLFNVHWVCRRCGFGVCPACYRSKIIASTKEEKITIRKKGHDEFGWPFCFHSQAHDIETLMLTQIIPKKTLAILGEMVHEVRTLLGIPQACGCEVKPLQLELVKAKTQPEISGSGSISCTTKKDLDVPHVTEPIVDDELGNSALLALTENLTKEVNKDAMEEDDDGEGNSALLRMMFQGEDSSNTMADNSIQLKEQNLKITGLDADLKSTDVKNGEIPNQRHEFEGVRQKKAPLPVKSYNSKETRQMFPDVPHAWLCFGRLLHLHTPRDTGNLKLFQEVWKRGQPVIVSHVSDQLNPNLWSPESFLDDFSELKNDLINCMTGKVLAKQPMKKFWEGFDCVNNRLRDEAGNPMLLKLKDWPPTEDFAKSLPSRYIDLMECLPVTEYTDREGHLNLASRLCNGFMRPDLGPKMYIAYGSGVHLEKGTTNLHLDISDAVNLMVYVGVPKDVDNAEAHQAVRIAIEQSDVDGITVDRVVEDGELPGALWHIYNARDADKIRDLINKDTVARGIALYPNHDPIHDQSVYLDRNLRQRLVEEYNVIGYPIVQFMGDAVFIPAGAPHQVRNLHNCIKIAEDFVSPENVSHCFQLTEEFRNLSETHTNHEDKLQIKNIMYHAIKDAVSVLWQKYEDKLRSPVWLNADLATSPVKNEKTAEGEDAKELE